MITCCYCQSLEKEMRPYGPKGAMLCFDCMMAEPSRETEAKRQMLSQMDACNGDVIVIGSEVGPYPLEAKATQ